MASVYRGGGQCGDSPSKLERSLDKVSDNSWSQTCEEGTGTLLGGDLAESADHTLETCQLCISDGEFFAHPVVNLGFELDSGLDHIDGAQGSVGDGTSESSGKGKSRSRSVSHTHPEWFGSHPPRIQVGPGRSVRVERVFYGLFCVLYFEVCFVVEL